MEVESRFFAAVGEYFTDLVKGQIEHLAQPVPNMFSRPEHDQTQGGVFIFSK